MSTQTYPGMTRPGHGRGLLDVVRRRYLLKLLVRKDVQIRYRGSVLGWFWSFLKPAAQFVVYYVAMGQFLGLNRGLENFAIYLFSGLVVINFFNEAFGNGTRSIVDNAALVKKIYLPRELFPVSSSLIALVNFLPQVFVLLIACLFFGWHPSLMQVMAIVLGILIILVLALGLSLLFSAIDVSVRDAESIVEMILMFTTWLSPVLYTLELVRNATSPAVFFVYQLNPITTAVNLFHYAFWVPTVSDQSAATNLVGTHVLQYGIYGLCLAAVFLLVGQLVFHRLEKNFAQDL
ncbi:ABC transporter permease [Pseudoclavibacter soli]|uniref:ABC transporter permease n=1 Tax=Pseudoclavibacter soli TaxID=452623 RepID=UPI000418659E|nr:ABC transporter permease [Pseudoclavibacter soli]